MNLGFAIDNRKCIGCHACTTACKSEHDVPIGVNRTWVKYIEKGSYPDTRRLFTVTRCNHCENPPCVTICPVRSLYIRPDGIVDFDNQRCIGCKSCMQACPYDALYIDPNTHTSAKCNFCAHRIDGGMEPACVIVCPEQAIVSGDLDNPASAISRLISRHPSTVRKPEKSTGPKLFYIEGDEAAHTPTEAPPHTNYLWSDQAQGVGHFARYAAQRAATKHPERQLGLLGPKGEEAHQATARQGAGPRLSRSYDPPSKGVLWGWEVSGYLWTKGISTGLVMLPLLLNVLGWLPLTPVLETGLAAVSLAFLLITTGLLVKDLDRPSRFLYVILRPQWNSWLVRGGYILQATGGLLTLWLAVRVFDLPLPGGTGWLYGLLAAAALMAAIYTGFLLAQAKGRDFWQSPLLPVHMLVQSLMMGGGALLLYGLAAGMGVLWPAVIALEVLLAAHLLLLAMEFNLTHHSHDAALTAHLITRGPLAFHFWSMVTLGNVAPLLLLTQAADGRLVVPAAALVLFFGLVTEHIWVRAPQLIPLR